MTDYDAFLARKETKAQQSGFSISKDDINGTAFPFQKDIIKWAVKKGRCAILTGCGSGKTLMQCEWARIIAEHEGGNVLILAPLSVVEQTRREAIKFGIADITVCRTQSDVKPGINITNYEMVEHFSPESFCGVVLDESSILKSFTSKTRGELTDKFTETKYKLLCTATIAPNDYTEIGTSCEFLGIMSRTEMLATYFVHDGGDTSHWRLKRPGRTKFWEWLASWAIYFNSPADLGYSVDGYDLPPLNIETIITETPENPYCLIPDLADTLEERRIARKESIADRVKIAADLCNGSPDQWLVWCDYNDESDALRRAINAAVEIKGADDPETKAAGAINFADGKIHALVSKPSIFGFGSNFQNCHKMIFCGLSDSYERFYQAVRRCWRFGQTQQVDIYVILSDRELNVLHNIERKQEQMDEMQRQMTALMKDIIISDINSTTRITTTYLPEERMELPEW